MPGGPADIQGSPKTVVPHLPCARHAPSPARIYALRHSVSTPALIRSGVQCIELLQQMDSTPAPRGKKCSLFPYFARLHAPVLEAQKYSTQWSSSRPPMSSCVPPRGQKPAISEPSRSCRRQAAAATAHAPANASRARFVLSWIAETGSPLRKQRARALPFAYAARLASSSCRPTIRPVRSTEVP